MFVAEAALTFQSQSFTSRSLCSFPETDWVRAVVVNKYDLIDSWPLTLTSKWDQTQHTTCQSDFIMFVHLTHCIRICWFSSLRKLVCVTPALYAVIGQLVATGIDNSTADVRLLVLLITPAWAVTFLQAHCFGPSHIPLPLPPPGSSRLTSLTLCPLMSAPSLAAAPHRSCLVPRIQLRMTETLITQEACVCVSVFVCKCVATTPIETGEPN